MKEVEIINDNRAISNEVNSVKMFERGPPKVKLGTGLEIAEAYNLLMEYNLSVPFGTCPGVGLGGLTLGGGTGFFVRSYGLTLDSVVEFELIDYKGLLLSIRDKGKYKDLFWALSGAGGGNFGVVTAITFQSFFSRNATFNCTASSGKEMEFISTWFHLQNQSHAIALILWFVQKQGFLGVAANGYYLGNESNMRAILDPLILLCNPDTIYLEELPFEKFILSNVGEKENWTNPKLGTTFSASSMFLTKPFDTSAINFIKHKLENPNIHYGFVLVKSLGDVFKHKSLKRRSSFAYRDTISLVSPLVIWKPLMPHNSSNSSYDDDPLAAEKRNQWIKEVRNGLAPYGKGAYVNYPDSTFENPLLEYFGYNLAKLIRIKEKYDPQNMFCYLQSLKPCFKNITDKQGFNTFKTMN